MPASTQSHRKRPRPADPLSKLFSMPNLAISSEIILGLALSVKAILAAARFFRPPPRRRDFGGTGWPSFNCGRG